ncbi:unnamed protein product [Prunus armeniaca]
MLTMAVDDDLANTAAFSTQMSFQKKQNQNSARQEEKNQQRFEEEEENIASGKCSKVNEYKSTKQGAIH